MHELCPPLTWRLRHVHMITYVTRPFLFEFLHRGGYIGVGLKGRVVMATPLALPGFPVCRLVSLDLPERA